jgi:hypothetical protein
MPKLWNKDSTDGEAETSAFLFGFLPPCLVEGTSRLGQEEDGGSGAVRILRSYV